MSDAAFKTAAYPGLTTDQLRAAIAEGRGDADRMGAELSRRAKVAAGDWSVMTSGERLRVIRAEREQTA